MRSSTVLLCVLVLAASVLLVSAPASAEVINATTGAQLFYDNFETNGENGVSQAPWEDTSGDYDPIAQVGIWGDGVTPIFEGSTTKNEHMIQVLRNYSGSEPDAFQGVQCMRIHRDSSASGVSARMLFPTEQTVTGQVIHLEEMVYVTARADAIVQILGYGYADSTLTTRINMYTKPDGSFVANAISMPNVTYKANEWQKWELDYTIGDSTFTLTVTDADGVSTTGAGDCSSSGSLAFLQFSQKISNTYYLNTLSRSWEKKTVLPRRSRWEYRCGKQVLLPA